MPIIVFILLVAAFVFALLAAFNKPSRFNMIGSALACYFLSIILPLLRTLFLITACVMLLGGCSFEAKYTDPKTGATYYGGAKDKAADNK